MKILVRFRNKEFTIFDLEDDSFTAPSGPRKGFFQLGKDRASGQPVVVNLDDVVALEPRGEVTGPPIA